MFTKLIETIAISPSYLDKFMAYSIKLKKEKSVRFTGFVLIALIPIVFLLANTVASEKSNSYSQSNIISGISSKQDILREWDNNDSDISNIYSKFGITRQDIVNLPDKPDQSLILKDNNYWGISRHPLINSESILALSTNGPTVYMFPMSGLSDKDSSGISAFKGRNSSTGRQFWILTGTGSYVQVGRVIGKNQPIKPQLEAKSGIPSGTNEIKSGDSFIYTAEFRNNKPDSLAENVSVEFHFDPNVLEYIPQPNSRTKHAQNYISIDVGDIGYSSSSHIVSESLHVKPSVPIGTNTCITTLVKSKNAEEISYKEDSLSCVDTIPNRVNSREKAQKPSIETTRQKGDELPPSNRLEVKNVSSEGNSDIANPGETLEYSLITLNTGQLSIPSYEVKIYVGDILEYSELDLENLAVQGGIFNSDNKEIVWTGQEIEPYSEIKKLFRVKIKSPGPSTSQATTPSTSYDCKVSGTYGNKINIDIACPPLKYLDNAPNISLQGALIVSLLTTALSCYFFLRSRLLYKESRLVRNIYQRKGHGSKL